MGQYWWFFGIIWFFLDYGVKVEDIIATGDRYLIYWLAFFAICVEPPILIQTLTRTVRRLLTHAAEGRLEARFALAALVAGGLFGDGDVAGTGGLFLDEGGGGQLVAFLALRVLKIKSVRGGRRRCR